MTDPTIEKATTAQSIEQAVLLTTAGLFDGRSRRRSGDAGPLTRVAGLPLFLRALLTLQRAGIKELLVLAGEEEQALKESLVRDARLYIPIRWMPVREFPPHDSRTWEALGAEVRGSCLVVGGRTLFSADLVRQLKTDVQEGEPCMVVNQGCDQHGPGGNTNPLVKVRGCRAIALYERLPGHGDGAGCGDGVAAELLVIPAALLRSSRPVGAVTATTPLRAMLEHAVSTGKVRTMTAAVGTTNWYQEVRDPISVRDAELTLLNSTHGECEGFIDKYVNRVLSRPLTRLFLKAGLSPNAVTILSIFIGLLAGVLFARGTYGAGVAGALLFQLSAVVDCCDGEVARVTFSESHFGAQLDLLGDNIVHVAIFSGIAWGLYVGRADGSWFPLGLGAAAVLGTLLSLWMVKRANRLGYKGDVRSQRRSAVLDTVLSNMANRDFSVIVIVLAVLGLLELFLWLTAIGIHVFWIALAWLTRPSAVPRA